MIIKCNNSFLYYNDNMGIINDYYQNIVIILANILNNNKDLNLNILFCNSDYHFNNYNKTIKITINYEHTLVKIGGRSIPLNTPFGNIYDDQNNKYFVRIENFDEMNNSDIIIDYSIPNIYNVKSCDIFSDFSKKHIYISQSIYNLNFTKENREIVILTTFINTLEERRHRFINDINCETIPHVNINNCFEKTDLQKLYMKTKIIINIHQTPHHHTFEELRVLPALECGVIVISEESPLKELIPYNELIIWSSYNKIIEKIKEVINNYDYYYELIFSRNNLNKLSQLNDINYKILNDKILSI